MGMLCQRITVRTGVVFTLVVLIVAGPLLTGTVACAGQARTDVNTKDAGGLTALERAVTQGDISSVLALIQAGADVNATDNSGRTVLSWAALQGRLEIVRAFARAGADVNVKDEQGWTPLTLAFTAAHFDVVQALIEAGAKADRNQLRKAVRVSLRRACL